MCSYANETYCSLYTVLNIVFKIELDDEMQILITIYDNFFFIYEHYLHIKKIQNNNKNLNCLYLIDKISKYISRIFLVLFKPINYDLGQLLKIFNDSDKKVKISNFNLIYNTVKFENISELTFSNKQIKNIIEIITKYSNLIKFILIWEKFYRGKTVVNTFLEQNLSFFLEKNIILNNIKNFIDEIYAILKFSDNNTNQECKSNLTIEELSSIEQINFEHQNPWSENYWHS
jgi:hypothetical protein